MYRYIIAHNVPVHTKLSIVIYLYVQCYQFVYCYSLFTYSIFILLLSVFCLVTVILLHCGSSCHENKCLVCVNIPGNKAHSDSVSDSDYRLWVFIFQEELKITNLVHSVQTEEEILSREKQLSLKLEKARIVKVIYRYSIFYLFFSPAVVCSQ